MTRQDQSAGAESQLLQAGRDIVINGVSAADVVEITRREVARVVEDLTLNAKAVAEERVQALGNRILERFAQAPEHLAAFGDPDFQFSLNDAGRAAASNDDAHTEDLLVDLLANRAEAGNTSRVRLATSQAIRAADKLTVEALNGLTALWIMTHLRAVNPEDLVMQVASAHNIAQAVTGIGLPAGSEWLQEADALNLVRGYGGNLVTRKPYRELLQHRALRHLVPGIPEDQFKELVAQAGNAMPDLGRTVCPHPLKPGFLQLRGTTRDEYLNLFDGETAPPSPELEQLIAVNGFGAQDPVAIEHWNARLDEGPGVRDVEQWWDAVPWCELSLVANVIGFVNARRHMNFHGAQTVRELLTPPPG